MDMKEALKRASTVIDIKPTEIKQVAEVMVFVDKALENMFPTMKVKSFHMVEILDFLTIIQNDPSLGKFHEIVKTWDDLRMISVARRLEEKYRRRDYTLLVQVVIFVLMILGIVIAIRAGL